MLADAQAVVDARREKMLAEAVEREVAIKEALAINAERKAAREAKKLAETEARQAAVEANDTARSERNKFNNQVDKLKGDIAAVKTELATIEDDKKRLVAEAAHLRGRVFSQRKEPSNRSRTYQGSRRRSRRWPLPKNNPAHRISTP
ncbi:MAG: hypothetical protein J6386_23190 [Candidatus Synoicihabitans palmerolidicus]|nr:hypothetical protein [Candidatus Synoicihabitans palmerolidicus]